MDPRTFSLLLLALPACTLNVDTLSDTKTVRHEGQDYGALRVEVGDVSGGLRFTGAAGDVTEVRAGMSRLASTDDDASELRRARLELVPRTPDLALVVADAPPEALELEWMDVTLPSSRALDVVSDTAEIRIEGVTGLVRVESDTGPVRLERVGQAIVHVDTGAVRGSLAGGDVETDTGDLDLRLTEGASGSLRARTDTGDVVVHVPAGLGLRIHASAGTGEVHVSAGGTELRTEHGVDVVIGDGAFDLDVGADTGDVSVIEG